MAVDTVASFFEDVVPQRIVSNPQAALSIGAIYQFDISGDGGGTWTLDFTKPEVRDGSDGSAQCNVNMGSDDFLALVNGSLDPMQAFMMGKLQVSGDMALAMKLQGVLGG